jgi:hypothetical protein
MKPIRLLILAGAISALSVSASTTLKESGIFVGTGGAATGYSINWSDRGSGGTWGVSSETFAGFTLTSLINGVEAGELSWANNVRNLGVGGTGSFGGSASINHNQDSSIIEAIRLDVPAQDEPVGARKAQGQFAGINWLAFDRLGVGTGAHVSITGFLEDPQASWEVSPFTGEEILSYDPALGKLFFTTTADSNDFGKLVLANPNATLSDEPISLVFSNDQAVNFANTYGVVGWGYLYLEDDSQPQPDPLIFAGVSEGEVQDGFVVLQGLGHVHLSNYPWIHHPDYGWLYSAMNTWADGGWFFDAQSSEWWASTAVAYPWKVRSDGEWSLE